ncbi:hypothetical protein EDD85DRAFT_837270 [Armillaria nabsnona]|nr:hypothetical protein EDD85DRAFT_837270 [Armillaria nabsnona]
MPLGFSNVVPFSFLCLIAAVRGAVIKTEHRARHACRLASCWLEDSRLTPKSKTTFIRSPISEIKFILGREYRWLMTVSKGIRSALTVWDITLQQKCSE